MLESSEFSYPNKIDFFGTTLLHLCDFTQDDLNNYLSYDMYSEDNLKASDNDVGLALTHALEESEEKYHEDIYGSYALDFNTFQNIYTPIHRKTMLIALYNFYECQVETLCREVNKLQPKNDIDDKWPERDVLNSFRKLLTHTAGFNFDKIDKNWQYLQIIKLIRNTLSHSEGEIDKRKTKISIKINGFCNKNEEIRISNGNIIIERGFIRELIAVLISLFCALNKEVIAYIHRYEEENGRFELILPSGASRTLL
ncbi:hypothetical protein [Hafnia psychrotolerans]|uniref:Uncharacterized protein n=1 Tax=Hafnia psychrotolerans TaxID=1477018 RepID=A0ABQ1H3Q5_9GAMM|nr:hypothetical protein [Hafnia psychrotolerans]GGA55858.1 hypothetical protein GCM10011328_34120 [Hafnia psychrotolerans]